MKKILAIMLAALMCLTFAACKKNEASNDDKDNQVNVNTGDENKDAADDTEKTDSDYEYVKSKGKLVVGVTDFEPMDYRDADGNWIGFDADMAKAFAEKLGVDVEFVEIEWDNKILELNSKTIDCVWNGMTLTEEALSSMECSDAYCNNQRLL